MEKVLHGEILLPGERTAEERIRDQVRDSILGQRRRASATQTSTMDPNRPETSAAEVMMRREQALHRHPWFRW